MYSVIPFTWDYQKIYATLQKYMPTGIGLGNYGWIAERDYKN